MTKPFCGYQHFLPCDPVLIFHMSSNNTLLWVTRILTLWPWPWSLIYLLKNLTLQTFEQEFWPYDLDLGVWPTVFIEKFNLANNFWTWSASYNLYFSNEYFYFSTNNISLWVPTCFTLRPRCWSLTYMNIPYEKIFLLVVIKLSNFDIWLNFVKKKRYWSELEVAFILHMSISCDN